MTLFICGVALIVIVTGILYLIQKSKRASLVFPAKNAKSGTKEHGATQDLTLFADFDGPLAVRTDGVRVAFIEVKGKSFDFKTPSERDDEVFLLKDAFSTIDHPFTIHRAMRPVDGTEFLTGYKEELVKIDDQLTRLADAKSNVKDKKALFKIKKKAAALEARKELIEEVYIPQAASTENSYEIHVYVTMSFKDGVDVQERAQRAMSSFMRRMMEAGYNTRRMNPGEIVEALINYYGRFPSNAEANAMGLRG